MPFNGTTTSVPTQDPRDSDFSIPLQASPARIYTPAGPASAKIAHAAAKRRVHRVAEVTRVKRALEFTDD